MPFPDLTGYAPDQLLNGSFGGYQIPPEALQYLSPEQIQMLGGSTQQNPVDQFIASLPPEIQSNPSAILQAAATDPSMAQAVAERFGLDAGSMTFENPYRNSFTDFALQAAKEVLIPYGATMGASALFGGGGAAGAGAAGGSATTYPLASTGGAITATPITAGVGAGTVAGSTAAAGAAGVGGMGSIGANGAGALSPAATGAGIGSRIGNFLGNWGPELAGGVNALLGYRAADQASDAETAAMQAAIEEQRRQYDQTRADLQPWMTAGQGALNNLQNPAASFAASPGYEWARNEGQRDIGNSFAARGGAASGNALRALTEFNTGLAQQDFGNWWNQQSSLAGLGQTATSNVASIGQNTSANVGNYLSNQGASRASGVLGKYGSVAGGLNDALTNYLYRRRA